MKKSIAEDDVISCNNMEKNLKEWDYNSVLSRDGNEPLEPTQSNTFRLAILDWDMPGLDGIEIL